MHIQERVLVAYRAFHWIFQVQHWTMSQFLCISTGHFQLLTTAKYQSCRDHILLKHFPGMEIRIASIYYDLILCSLTGEFLWILTKEWNCCGRRQMHSFIKYCQYCLQSSHQKKWKIFVSLGILTFATLVVVKI